MVHTLKQSAKLTGYMWLCLTTGCSGPPKVSMASELIGPRGSERLSLAQYNGRETETARFSFVTGKNESRFSYAYVAHGPTSKQFAVINGQSGPQFTEIQGYVAAVQLSEDGKRTAYVARNGQKWFAVVDGVAGAEYDEVELPIVSRDGKRVAYSAKKDAKWVVVVEGTAGPEFDKLVTQPSFSADGKHLSYIATKGRDVSKSRDAIVIDGKVGPEFVGIVGIVGRYGFSADQSEYLVFSPKGNRHAYISFGGSERYVERVVVGDFAGRDYDKIIKGSLAFSPDGEHVKFEAVERGQHVLVVDNKEIARDDQYGYGLGLPVPSPDFTRNAVVKREGTDYRVFIDGRPEGLVCGGFTRPFFNVDGRRVTYSCQLGNNRWVAVLDGRAGPEFERISNLMFSPKGKHLSYIGTKGKKQVMVIDGRVGPEFDSVIIPNFSDTENRVAYVAEQSRKFVVVVDGQVGPEFDRVLRHRLKFSPNGRRYAYSGLKGRQNYLVVDGSVIETEFNIGEIIFNPHAKHLAYIMSGGSEPDPSTWKDVLVIQGGPKFEYDTIFPDSAVFRSGAELECLVSKAGALHKVRFTIR